jgi:hypothetical protein
MCMFSHPQCLCARNYSARDYSLIFLTQCIDHTYTTDSKGMPFLDDSDELAQLSLRY